MVDCLHAFVDAKSSLAVARESMFWLTPVDENGEPWARIEDNLADYTQLFADLAPNRAEETNGRGGESAEPPKT